MAKRKLQTLTGYTKPDRGLVFLFIGYGKGKTTAAMGTALRAAGYGWNARIIQFIKGEWESGEYNAVLGWNAFAAGKSVSIPGFDPTLKRVVDIPRPLGCIDFTQTGKGFVKILGDKKPLDIHRQAARQGLALVRAAFKDKKYQVVVADELVTAVEEKLITQDDVLRIIKAKPKSVHLVLTGHKHYPKIIAACDTVTEMKKLKHPFDKKILAVRGVDY
jgi:cob(I)alamin adenosyltransferase